MFSKPELSAWRPLICNTSDWTAISYFPAAGSVLLGSISTNSMSGLGSSILIEAAAPRVLVCLICNAGWLNFKFVLLTSKTAEGEVSVPSFDVMETVAIMPPLVGPCTFSNSESGSALLRSIDVSIGVVQTQVLFSTARRRITSLKEENFCFGLNSGFWAHENLSVIERILEFSRGFSQ